MSNHTTTYRDRHQPGQKQQVSDANTYRVPAYRRHRQSGQAIVTLTDGMGNRRDVLLGKYGTAASRHEYARVIGEWEASGRRLPQPVAAHDLTVSELILAYWKHVQEYYRHQDGTATSEVTNIRYALRVCEIIQLCSSCKAFLPMMRV